MNGKFILNITPLQIKQYFSILHVEYPQTNFMIKEIAQRIIENLSLMSLNPEIILNLACGTGYTANLLGEFFPKAKIMGLDTVHNVTKKLAKNIVPICADAYHLPFAKPFVDLIVINLLLPWHEAPLVFFQSLKQILKSGGLLIFALFGPQTFAAIDCPLAITNIHDTGNFLQEAGFMNPVLERQTITVHYKNQAQLLHDLRPLGWELYQSDLTKIKSLEFSYEIILAHAWQENEISVPLTKVLRKNYSSI